MWFGLRVGRSFWSALWSDISKLTSLPGFYLYVKSKSTLTQSVREWQSVSQWQGHPLSGSGQQKWDFSIFSFSWAFSTCIYSEPEKEIHWVDSVQRLLWARFIFDDFPDHVQGPRDFSSCSHYQTGRLMQVLLQLQLIGEVILDMDMEFDKCRSIWKRASWQCWVPSQSTHRLKISLIVEEAKTLIASYLLFPNTTVGSPKMVPSEPEIPHHL